MIREFEGPVSWAFNLEKGGIVVYIVDGLLLPFIASVSLDLSATHGTATWRVGLGLELGVVFGTS
jgi:hypothetical protein